jgi:DNA helicase II / ATP-dependent DNA helicase PcrA
MLDLLEGLITKDDIANIAASEQLILDDVDRVSVLEAMRSIDVQACPGSGKTTLIATKLILLSKKWPFLHRGVCVLSHTNVAKDEIISRIKRSNTIEAQRLLSYPHFIGTIQEFVNRFLALPLIRESGVYARFIEGDDGFKEVMKSGVNLGTLYTSLFYKCGGEGKPWPQNEEVFENMVRHLGSLFWLNTDFDLAFYGEYGSLLSYKNDMSKKVFPKLIELKVALEKKGVFQYRDMFAYAGQLIMQHDHIHQAIRSRFPCVFLDEMQDTQKFQDEILNKIFPIDDSSLIVQRFGDPDQAIFHGIESEKANESFNGKSRGDMDFVIHKTHRFDCLIADKIKPLSFNEIPLESELSIQAIEDRAQAHSVGGKFEHTVIVFNDDNRDSVVEYFSQNISDQFSAEYKVSEKFIVKVVGAVGNEIDPNSEQLKIGHYWNGYDKKKSKTNFKESKLIEAVRYCRQSQSVDWAEKYKYLIDCILKLMRIVGNFDDNGKYFSSSTLRDELRKNGNWDIFRKTIYLMLSDKHEINQRFWDDINRFMNRSLGLENIPEEAAEYLVFTDDAVPANVVYEEEQQEESFISLPGNKIKHADGFQIEFSTIHGVKGETHDATLIVETKHHTFDVETMLPFLIGKLPSEEHQNQQLPDKPNSRRKFSPNKVFMRQFYVAMSRPKHLLCIALHSDRLSEPHKVLLQEKGWKVVTLESHGEEAGV